MQSIRNYFTKWHLKKIGHFSKSAKRHLELFDFQNLNWSKKFHPRSKTFTKTTFSGKNSFTLKKYVVMGLFLDHPVYDIAFRLSYFCVLVNTKTTVWRLPGYKNKWDCMPIVQFLCCGIYINNRIKKYVIAFWLSYYCVWVNRKTTV